MRLFILQTGIRIRKVRANFAHGIDETEGITEATNTFIETQPNNDGYQLQNTYSFTSETVLFDHNF